MIRLVRVRITLLTIVSVLSFVVLGFSSYIMWCIYGGPGSYLTYVALLLAVSSLSLISLPTMLIVGANRRGAFFTMIAVELPWLLLLWVLWLISALKTKDQFYGVEDCKWASGYPIGMAFCIGMHIVESFSFLLFAILAVYSIALLAFTIRAHSRGNSKVWASSVHETDFDARGTQPSTPAHTHAVSQQKYEETVVVNNPVYPSFGPPGVQYPTQKTSQVFVTPQRQSSGLTSQ